MAFHALADYQNHVIGWLQWEQSLEMGPWYDFREFGCHLGNVGSIVETRPNTLA